MGRAGRATPSAPSAPLARGLRWGGAGPAQPLPAPPGSPRAARPCAVRAARAPRRLQKFPGGDGRHGGGGGSGSGSAAVSALPRPASSAAPPPSRSLTALCFLGRFSDADVDRDPGAAAQVRAGPGRGWAGSAGSLAQVRSGCRGARRGPGTALVLPVWQRRGGGGKAKQTFSSLKVDGSSHS